MSEFLRAKEEIDGRGVMITSWYDSGEGAWHASAPGLVHLLHHLPVGALIGETRQQAVKRVVDALRREYPQR